jgi:hypothetical protein
MKWLSVALGFLVLLACEMALAAGGIATTINGTVQVQTGAAPARALRLGDTVQQGDTVSTGAASSVVLKFDDGQIVALSSNSRMAVSAYAFDSAAPERGNVLMSLFTGGMRAITGLIGRRSPQQVAYRAASATIGIRGTDVTIATDGGNVVVSVTEGAISFSFGGKIITVPAGDGVNAKSDGTFQQSAAAEIVRQLEATAEGRALLLSINGLTGLSDAIRDAGRTPEGPGTSTGTLLTPVPGTASSPGGGGTASPN